MSFGITDYGFNLKRFEDCLSELEAVIRELFGDDVNLDAESVHGQLVNVLALREADLWERMQAAYAATRPTSSSGISLDDLLQLTGLSRIPETASQVDMLMRGPSSTLVSTGYQVANVEETVVFEAVESVTLQSSSCVEITIEVTAAAAGAYTVTVDGVTYTFTATTETVDEIIDGLAAVISAALGSEVTVTKNYDDDQFTLYFPDHVDRTVTVAGNLSIKEVGGMCQFMCTDTGPISVPAGELTVSLTPTAVTSVVNPAAAMPGRLIETDTEARIRYARSFAGINGATAVAIENRILQEVANVSWCRVYSNDTNLVDAAGRPPHSVEAMVTGGTAADVAEKIFEVKAAGIATFGNQSQNVYDDYGELHVVKFSRIVDVYAWVRVTVTLDEEDTYPVDGDSALQAAIVDYGILKFTLGRDLVNDKFKVPVHDVRGIRSSSIELAVTTTPGGTPSYGSPGADVVVDSDEQAIFSADRVVVVRS